MQRLPDKAAMVKAALGPKDQTPDYLPARMVNEFIYCPRLFLYEWVEGIFAHSADTVEGAQRHARVDDRTDPLPAPGDDDAADAPIVARSVTLSSDTHGIIAKIDLVEAEGRSVTPVDYKKGKPRPGDDGPEVWPANRVQVGVQVLSTRCRVRHAFPPLISGGSIEASSSPTGSNSTSGRR